MLIILIFQQAPYYQFGYQVRDGYNNQYLGHMEHNDGKITKGREIELKVRDRAIQRN